MPTVETPKLGVSTVGACSFYRNNMYCNSVIDSDFCVKYHIPVNFRPVDPYMGSSID